MQTHTMTITPEALEEIAAPAVPDTIAANARELDDLRSAKRVIEEREATLRAALLDYLDTNGLTAAVDGPVAISLSEYLREGIDKARMEALYPKVLADCVTTTPVRQIRVKITG